MNKDFNELEEKNLNFIYQQLIKLKVVTGKWKELKFKYINDDIQLSYIPYLSEDDNEIKIDITDFAVKEQIKKSCENYNQKSKEQGYDWKSFILCVQNSGDYSCDYDIEEIMEEDNFNIEILEEDQATEKMESLNVSDIKEIEINDHTNLYDADIPKKIDESEIEKLVKGLIEEMHNNYFDIKISDLIVLMLACRPVPKKIKYHNKIYDLKDRDYITKNKNYEEENFLDELSDFTSLNDKVEILVKGDYNG